VFLHAVREGPANQSYGLQVARLAGVPKTVIQDARRYLAELERRDHSARPATPQQQLDLAPPPDPARDPARDALLAQLAAADPDAMSPRAALDLLFELKERLRAER
jgi:DNA mismatch repair protein MutS